MRLSICRLAPSVRRGREASGARSSTASGSRGVPGRASEARVDCSCRHGATLSALPGGKPFTVRRQSVGALKSTSKVDTHFCATPQFHASGQARRRSVRLASPLTGDPDSLVDGSGASYPQRSPTPTNGSRAAVRTHCAERETTAAARNVISRDDGRRTWGRSLLAPGDANIDPTLAYSFAPREMSGVLTPLCGA